MRDWNRGIRKRREAKLRALRGGRRSRSLPADRVWAGAWEKREGKRARTKERSSLWSSGNKNMRGSGEKRGSRFLIQVFISFFLLTVTYLIFQSNVPASRQAQDFIGEVMRRDFNFATVSAWYEEMAGGKILPTLSSSQSEKKTDKKEEWVTSVRGKVIRPFQEDKRGILIQAAEGTPVVAAAEGWVVFVGKKEGLGETVILRHAKGNETWYGWLKKPQVKEKDWVKPRQLIGEPGGEGGSVYIARKSGEGFVDPQDVIAVD